jgi:protein involved in sex pheromone biosynthesis
MKKVLSILAAASMLAVIACGPSAEDKKKADEKRIQDSIEAAQRMADSLAAMEAAMMPADTAAIDTAVAPATVK